MFKGYSSVATASHDVDEAAFGSQSVPVPAVRLPSKPPPTASFVRSMREQSEGGAPHSHRSPTYPGSAKLQRKSAPADERPSQGICAASPTSSSPSKAAGKRPVSTPTDPSPSPLSSSLASVTPPSKTPPTRSFMERSKETVAENSPAIANRASNPAKAAGAGSPVSKSRDAPGYYGAPVPAERVKAVAGQHAHAHVGANVSSAALEAIMASLIEEARRKFHAKKFDEALPAFQYCLALTEKTVKKHNHEEYGAIQHNIASCLHCLGEMDKAKAHYLAALAAFQRNPPSRLWVALNGDLARRRCDFVRERLDDIEAGRKPDLDHFLDGSGQRRLVTDEVVDPLRSVHPHGSASGYPVGYMYTGDLGWGVGRPIYGAHGSLVPSRLHGSIGRGGREHFTVANFG